MIRTWREWLARIDGVIFCRFCRGFFHMKIGSVKGELWLTSSFTACGVFMEISKHIFTFSAIFLSLAVVQNMGISTQEWLVFNCVFRFGGRTRTYFVSDLKTVFSSLLYPYDIDTIVAWRHFLKRSSFLKRGVGWRGWGLKERRNGESQQITLKGIWFHTVETSWAGCFSKGFEEE